MKHFFKKYSYIIWVLLYAPIYMIWFMLLEKHVTDPYIIYSPIDDMIPFCEYFIVPYLFWFFFMAIFFVFFFFYDKKEFLHMAALLGCGMTLFLIISTVFPNGLNLRCEVDPEKNIFCKLVAKLWTTDTSTNVFPSIHVYNTLAIMVAVARCHFFRHHKIARAATMIVGMLIVLSTMFLKQHSIWDVAAGFVFIGIFYVICYRVWPFQAKPYPANNL